MTNAGTSRLYGALHMLDFPPLMSRPSLRTALIVGLCGLGFAFSSTGVVIGWRRLRRDFSAVRPGATTSR